MMTGIVLAASLTRFLLIILIVIPISIRSILLDLQSSANFDGSLLGTKYFNPFLEDPDTYQLLHNSDLDPDINMFSSTSNLLSRCTYLNSRQFNNLYNSFMDCLYQGRIQDFFQEGVHSSLALLQHQ